MLKFAAIQFGKRTFFQAYFTTPVTMKQTYYKSSYISRAELIIMKWKIFDIFSANVSEELFLQNK